MSVFSVYGFANTEENVILYNQHTIVSVDYTNDEIVVVVDIPVMVYEERIDGRGERLNFPIVRVVTTTFTVSP